MSKVQEAFRLIVADNGGMVMDEDVFIVPAEYRGLIDDAEAALGTLSPEDFETFCCGEDTAKQAVLAGGGPALQKADELLEAFFEDDWELAQGEDR